MTFAQRLTRFIDLFYVGPLRRIMPLQTFRYAVCGGGNVLLNLFLYAVLYNFILCKQVVQVTDCIVVSPHIAASWIVFPVTFFSGFWLQKHIAFQYFPLRGCNQLFRYMLSVAGSFVLDYLMLKLFVDAVGIYPTPSKALSILIVTVYSYLMQKYFTFRGARV